MKKIDQFVNKYSLSKTLRFSLIPVGKTEENFEKKMLLQEDEQRAADYIEVKRYIDEYHKFFINKSLSKVKLEGVPQYAELYLGKRTEKTTEQMKGLEGQFRKQITDVFKKASEYTNLFKAEMIKELLPGLLKGDDEKLIIVNKFYNFTTYFTGFQENRKNIYTAEEKSTGVAFRCINDNLPKFLDNLRTYNQIKNLLKEELKEIFKTWKKQLLEVSKDLDELDFLFSEYFYSYFLTQLSIDTYNGIIGDLNKQINLYSQKHKEKLPLFKPLFKQILSEREKIFAIPDKFTDDEELLESLKAFYNGDAVTSGIKKTIEQLDMLFREFSENDMSGVHLINKGAVLTDLSKAVTGDWAFIQNKVYQEYDLKNPKKAQKADEKYYEERKKYLKSFKSIALETIQNYLGNKEVQKYYEDAVSSCVEVITKNYKKASQLIEKEYKETKRLYKNDNAIGLIKDFLDAVKALENTVKPLEGTGKEEHKDEAFYGRFLPLLDQVQTVDDLYDKVRNYLTQKPYSKDKIKLNFGNPALMSGWPFTKEIASSAIILRSNDKYYLGIMDPQDKSCFKDYPTASNGVTIEKMYYYQAADPAKDIQNLMVIDGKTVKKNGRKDSTGENKVLEELKNTYLPKNINRIRTQKSYSLQSPAFKRADLNSFIEYYAQRAIEYYDKLQFSFKKPSEYKSFLDFTNHVNAQAYQVSFKKIDKDYIDSLVDQGSLYLFQIYNKDFSDYSKGTPNLHTLYFRMLFAPENLQDVVFKLNGEAEMFYRKASIKKEEQIVHRANRPLENKNPNNPKKESTFQYDLIKDKRFTRRMFSLHLPITLNFKAEGQEYLNILVREELAKNDDNYVIGIDRGERNLLYICVINSKGEIVEQYSLNEIVNEHKGIKYSTDYHKLLDKREKERDKARQNWTAVESIKELKEGYLSQVIRKICELVIKYDAIVAMEDLNSGFKNSRLKVEKQVYQKFEKQLVEKMQFLADKKLEADETGGVLKAYQLTNADPKYIGKTSQNGFIFYVPAWLTSKIDPVTGFADFLKPKYSNEVAAKDFLSKFHAIDYNEIEDMFEFSFDYTDFPRGATSYKNRWTLYSNGERIRTFRNPEKNNEWDNITVNLTEEFKKVFEEKGINYRRNIKEQILEQTGKEFFEQLIKTIALMLQIRNSITGNVDIDYLISPVKDMKGSFYDSRDYELAEDAVLPKNADANGAYNIARKALLLINKIQDTSESELDKLKLTIKNEEWLKYVQNNG